jgi:hypothetical protein
VARSDVPDEKPPFDSVKAGFYLVAFVIAANVGMSFFGAVACLWNLDKIVAAGLTECKGAPQFFEMLSGALAAALAFAGGKSR